MQHIFGDNMKINAIHTKIYKPEILTCPKCRKNLKYAYTVSFKTIQFTSGKKIKIKNMGYLCPYCNDNFIYPSLTASKLAYKGLTYSCKTICFIDYYKRKGLSREKILDEFEKLGVIITSRNIDFLYNKFLSYYDYDLDSSFNIAFKEMLKNYNEIRLSIDLITIEKDYYILFYNGFNGDIINKYVTNSFEDKGLLSLLNKLLNNEKLKYVISVRGNVSPFISIMKSISKSNVKYISYTKF